ATEEHLRGGASDRRRILSDDSDSWFQQVGQQNIVEADQRNALVKSQTAKSAECADGDQVLPSEKGGGGPRTGEHICNGRLGLFDSSQVESYESLVGLNPFITHCFDIASVPIRSRRDRMEVAEVADAA